MGSNLYTIIGNSCSCWHGFYNITLGFLFHVRVSVRMYVPDPCHSTGPIWIQDLRFNFCVCNCFRIVRTHTKDRRQKIFWIINVKEKRQLGYFSFRFMNKSFHQKDMSSCWELPYNKYIDVCWVNVQQSHSCITSSLFF